MLTIRIYNHSPRKTRGKNVLKSVDGGGETRIGQESLFGENNNDEKMILVRKAFLEKKNNNEKMILVRKAFW